MNEDTGAQPYLMLRDPDGQMTRISLDDLPVTIGRRSTNKIQVLDPTVSRDHARIDRDGNDYFVEDLGSTHGTFVNQERISRHDLAANDRIRLGGAMGHVLTFRSGDEFTMLIGTTGKQNVTEPMSTAGGSNVAQQQSARSLAALLEISKALNSSLRITDVLEKVMDAVIALTGGERCLMLLGENADELETAAHRNLTTGSDEVKYSQSVVRNVFDSNASTILTDVAEDERFSAQQSIVGLNLRTVMCVPLRLSHFSGDAEPRLGEYQTASGGDTGTSRILGVLYVDRRSPTRHFGDQDLAVLESFASHAAIAIDNARLYEEALEKRRLEEDVRVANRIQRSLLLSDFPEASWYDVHAVNIPSRGVGGDYYEFFEIEDGGLGFAVGDVSGKGVPAAMLMATLQASFLAAIRGDTNLADACAHVNDFIVERTTPERYATFFVGKLQSDGTLHYVNAGHNPPMLINNGNKAEALFGGGLPLGLFPAREYEIQETHVLPGGVIVAYSDGVSEANDPQENEYGMERFERAVQAHCDESAERISKAVFDDVELFADGTPPFDDLTLLIVKRTQ